MLILEKMIKERALKRVQDQKKFFSERKSSVWKAKQSIYESYKMRMRFGGQILPSKARTAALSPN